MWCQFHTLPVRCGGWLRDGGSRYLDVGAGKVFRPASARIEGTQSVEQHPAEGAEGKTQGRWWPIFDDLMANVETSSLGRRNKNRRLSPEIFSAGSKIPPPLRKDQAAHLYRPTGSQSKTPCESFVPRCRQPIATVNHKGACDIY
jgi:hypothetical protein